MLKKMYAAFALVICLLCGTPAFSQDHKASAPNGKAAPTQLDGNAPLKEHEKKPDALGQLGLTRSDLGIYTLIVFGLVFFILSKFAWKPIVEGLDKREALILSAKEEAEKSLAETQKLRAELEASRHKGAEEVKAMIDEARRDAEALREKLKADATAEIATERDRLRREIESAKDQALTEIWGKAVQLATLISTKTVKKQLTEDDHRKLVDESLSELKSSLNKAG